MQVGSDKIGLVCHYEARKCADSTVNPRIAQGTRTLAETTCRLCDWRSNDLTGNDEFDSAILLTSSCVIVCSHWLGIAIAPSCNRIGIDTGFHEVITDRSGSLF